MNFFFLVGSGLFLICFLVSVHELGHFLAAKLFRVKVLQFSVGLGRPVFSRVVGETQYVLRLFPLGGYLRLLDVASPPGTPEHGRSFQEQSKLARMTMILAGPAINLALAFVLLPLAFMVGTNFPDYQAEKACISALHPQSPLFYVLQPADCIVSINNLPVPSWGLASLETSVRGIKSIVIERQGELITLLPDLYRARLEAYGLTPSRPVVVGTVAPNLAAARAGLQTGDRILMLQGQPVSLPTLPHFFAGLDGKALSVVYERAGQVHQVSLLPENREGRWLVGLSPAQGFVYVKFGFMESLRIGTDKLIAMLYSTIGLSQQHFEPQSSANGLGGPLALVQIAGQAAQLGAGTYLTIVAFLSLQFALLNLLPIPVFDGGQLVLLGYETLYRKPPSSFGKAVYQRIGIIIVMLLVLIALWNDLFGAWG